MILRKIIFSWKRYVFLIIIFWQWAKFFDLLANLSCMDATNCILLVHANTLRRSIFFDIFVFFVIFGQWAKFVDLLAKFSNLVIRFAFCLSIGTLPGKIVFFLKKIVRIFINLGHWANLFHPYGKLFGVLANFFRQGCQNCLVVVLKNGCREIFVWKKSFLLFPDIER